jgi:hypothetical protein
MTMPVTDYVEDVQVGGDGSFLFGNDPLALIEAGITRWAGGEGPTFVDITTTRHHNKIKKRTYTYQKVTKYIATYTIDAFVDAGDNMAAIRPGAILKNVNLLSGGEIADARGYRVFMAEAIVKTAPIDSGGIGGVFSFRFSIDSQGDYDVYWNGESLDPTVVAGTNPDAVPAANAA